MNNHWHVGMKVVFVGYPLPTGVFHGRRQIKRVAYLTVGKVYTILDMDIRARYVKTQWEGPSFYVGFVDPTYGRVWHHNSGFRPVEPRDTDISIFTAMLDKQTEPA
jgi:hypothetical protein